MNQLVVSKQLLRISELRVAFRLPKRQLLKAVDGVDITVHESEIHALIGESGSGKTVTALAAMGLLDSSATISGRIVWQGRDVTTLSEREWRDIRGQGISILFQDAAASLNPALRVGSQLLSVIRLHQGLDGEHAEGEAMRILRQVRLPDPNRVLLSYPQELSGGMAQRAALALALACRPRLLIADEPTSALDVTIAVQIIALLRSIRDELGLAMLVISHDLGVVSRIADRVSVMYLGQIIETGAARAVLAEPLHPYTVALLDAASLDRNAGNEDKAALAGDIPGALNPPTGCRFHPRCPKAFAPCDSEQPALTLRDTHGHSAACWLKTPD